MLRSGNGLDRAQQPGPLSALSLSSCSIRFLKPVCRTLVRAFPQAGLGVYVAADGGTIYESEVFEASHSTFGAPKRYARRNWGDRAVLVLIGHRLGINGVNPVYYDTLKVRVFAYMWCFS